MNEEPKKDMDGTNREILNALLIQYGDLSYQVKQQMTFAEFCVFVIEKEQLKRIDSCDY